MKFTAMKYYLLYITVSLSFLFSETIYRVPIHGTIDLGLPPYIQRAIEEAEADGADAVIFDITSATVLVKLWIPKLNGIFPDILAGIETR